MRKRITKGNIIYHALNRANGRLRIFKKPRDFEAYEEILAEGLDRFDMRMCGYCIMSNHWHLVLWPKGELVYMWMPRTAGMNDELDNFISFITAWLCNPDCDTNDLTWDDNNDLQINLIDWATNTEYFDEAFRTNGRYLLTDFRNSVIGKVNLDGSVDEISYNAWGSPSYAGDLEGLNVLWNGYYYDYETDNYYLRNRYYSPLERRFLTQDPHGVNPDGNWNNPYNPLSQYYDGYGLTVYGQGDPVNSFDPWGLWKYAYIRDTRHRQTRTFVEANGVWEMKHNIRGLAQLVRLNEDEFDKWGKRATHSVYGVKKCGAWVANTAYVDGGNLKISEKIKITNPYYQGEMERIRNHFWRQGYAVVMSYKNTRDSINTHLADEDVIAWAFVGHGFQGGLVTTDMDWYTARAAVGSIHHKLAQVILFTCEAGYRTPAEKKLNWPSWKDIVSKYGTISMSSQTIRAGSNWEKLPVQ